MLKKTVAEDAKIDIKKQARELATVIKNDIPTNTKKEDVMRVIEQHLAMTFAAMTDTSRREAIKQEIYNIIAVERRKEDRLIKGKTLIKKLYTEIPVIVEEVKRFTKAPHIDITVDIQGVLRRRLDGFYKDPSLRDDIDGLAKDIRFAVIQSNPSIEIVYSDEDIAKRVKDEYDLYINTHRHENTVKKLVATTGVTGIGLGALFNGIVEQISAGQVSLQSIWALIGTGVGGVYLAYKGVQWTLKIINAARDSILEMQNYRDSSEKMMKDFTNETNFKKMLDCLDQEEYAGIDRYQYKKELLATMNRSRHKYAFILRKVTRLFSELNATRQKSDEVLKIFIAEYGNKYFQLEVRDEIREINNSAATGADLRKMYQGLFHRYFSEVTNNEQHIDVLKKIFMPHYRKDQINYRLFKRLEQGIDKLGSFFQKQREESEKKKTPAKP